ncbi:hypothetical protein RHGRI_022062 [Rhododendron griersonianum]|uniref:F-box domain-containing protein n=1 Tax=Rhododendron griersonianum TaxID=479676 RepID=A0AAV6JMG4_9ERIC|nr:hypothetical protein RHGRI_022062 [Rhododendron griersonianum]
MKLTYINMRTQKISLLLRKRLTRPNWVKHNYCIRNQEKFICSLICFFKSGFQQIQLDIQFLRTTLKETAEDEAAIDFLLDEECVKLDCSGKESADSTLTSQNTQEEKYPSVMSEGTMAVVKPEFCDKRGSSSLADRICLLPDDILVLILSFLTVEEAAATSILSTRWHELWKLVSRLDFYGTKAKGKINLPYDEVQVERPKYVEWVTQVLRLNKCFTLDELRIHFSLDYEFSQAIDKWIDVAITKRVPKLELNLSSLRGHNVQFLINAILFHPGFFFPVLYTGVGCSLSNSSKLSSLGSSHVVGFTIPLKHLEVKTCLNIKAIEICNTNLISFSYFGPKIKLLVVNVPHLVELPYKGGVAECLHDFLNQVSCYLPQLRALTWSFAAPLMLEWETHPTINGGKARSSVKCSHKYLKVVEMAGYCDGTSDFELAMYFIENAVALDKVVINPCCQYSGWIRSPSPKSTKCEELAGRSRAYQQFLGKEVPSKVELVLL